MHPDPVSGLFFFRAFHHDSQGIGPLSLSTTPMRFLLGQGEREKNRSGRLRYFLQESHIRRVIFQSREMFFDPLPLAKTALQTDIQPRQRSLLVAFL
jgi:hypothetical protein